MRDYPWKCATCHKRTVYPVTLPSYATELEHDGRKYPLEITDVEATRCDRCGTIVLEDSGDEKLIAALRSAAEIMNPSEIREQRTRLGLTQRQLSTYIDVAESTISRWETGAQIQQKAMDNLLRLFFGLPEARRMLGAPHVTWAKDSFPVPLTLTFSRPRISTVRPQMRSLSWAAGVSYQRAPQSELKLAPESNTQRESA